MISWFIISGRGITACYRVLASYWTYMQVFIYNSLDCCRNQGSINQCKEFMRNVHLHVLTLICIDKNSRIAYCAGLEPMGTGSSAIYTREEKTYAF